MGIAEWTPNTRASYDAVATTPRGPSPPTTTALPRRLGLDACSAEAKKASMSRCRIVGVVLTSPMLPYATDNADSPGGPSGTRPGRGEQEGSDRPVAPPRQLVRRVLTHERLAGVDPLAVQLRESAL